MQLIQSIELIKLLSLYRQPIWPKAKPLLINVTIWNRLNSLCFSFIYEIEYRSNRVIVNHRTTSELFQRLFTIAFFKRWLVTDNWLLIPERKTNLCIMYQAALI